MSEYPEYIINLPKVISFDEFKVDTIEGKYAFISMRKFINENKDIFKRITTIEYKILEYDDNFAKIFNALEPRKIENQKIFFNGDI